MVVWRGLLDQCEPWHSPLTYIVAGSISRTPAHTSRGSGFPGRMRTAWQMDNSLFQ